MEQLASNRGVWVRVVIALITATFVLVVGAGAAFARVAAGETDPEVAATVENTGDEAAATVEKTGDEAAATVEKTGDEVAPVVEVARDDGAAEVERATVAPPDVGGTVKDTTDKVGGTVKDTTDTTGGAVKDVTGKTGGGNGITGKTGGSLDNTQRVTGKSVAGVIPRDGDSRRPRGVDGRVDGISRSKKRMLSVDRISREKGGGNDLASVIQAPGTALGDSFDSAGGASSGSSNLKLPFDLGTLPVTGAELALILLVGLATSCAGWGIVRLARSRERRQRRGAPEVQTVT